MDSFEKVASEEKLAELAPTYDAALEVFERLYGGPLAPFALPVTTPEFDALPMLTIGVEGAASFARLTASGGLDDLAQQGEWNWPNIFRAAAHVPATEYVQAQRVRARLQRLMAAAFEAAGVDVYVTAPRVGPSLSYTNLTGHPEVVLRCGRTADGMPVSLSLVGRLYRESDILRAAHAFERATGWRREWPEV
jgi:Asp-tRNA(Asn)/Glu-tRNA(Gln) amidotransferase A subunit family amidase